MKIYKNFYVYKNNVLVREVNNGQERKFKIPIKPSYFFVTDKNSEHKSVYGENVIKMDFDNSFEAKDWLKTYETMKSKIYGFPHQEYTVIHNEYPGDVTPNFNINNMTVGIFDIETETEGRQFLTSHEIQVRKKGGSLTQNMSIGRFELLHRDQYEVKDIIDGLWKPYEDTTYFPKGGWPNHETANEAINLISISLKGNGHEGHIKCFGWGDAEVFDDDAEFIKCEDERDLLLQFILHWSASSIDIISGWNIAGFDIPYLIKRVIQVLGEDYAKMLSPWKLIIEKNTKSDFGKEITKYDIVGINIFDYLELYKKFTYTDQESFKLDYIALAELDDKKVEFDCSFRELYTKYYQAFVDYNIHDVRLVRKLDDKLGFISLGCALMYKAKVCSSDIFTTVRIWDVIISNALYDRKIYVPTYLRHAGAAAPYVGGYVKNSLAGFFKWLVSIDATSLYPSIERTFNISPETLLDPKEFITMNADDIVHNTEKSRIASAKAKSLNACVTANGAMFSKDKQGIIPELNEFYFNQRVKEKKLGKDYEKAAAAIANILKERGVTV